MSPPHYYVFAQETTYPLSMYVTTT